MPSPILARADALMQRRRSTTLDADDDVPVLTDAIETPPEVFEPIAEIAPIVEIVEEPTSHPLLDAGLRDILAHELARRVEQRLAAELPRIIESTVRDFLAEQEMIAALQPQE